MWRLWYGRFWQVQIVLDWWLSFGVHVDLRHRRGDHHTFGPYVDLFLGVVTISLGWQPVYAGDLERALSISRGGREA